SSSGLPGHRACSSSRVPSGRSPRSGADVGRAGSSAAGRLLTATPAGRDGGAPGHGLRHLRSRHSPGRAARAAARDAAHDTQPCGALASRHASPHARPRLRG
uniref:RIKEN cDNA E130116L18 gene n=1 Tax=Mus spicilegus TaxID=10103 RepID=A0A8C6HDA2_MUSSI